MNPLFNYIFNFLSEKRKFFSALIPNKGAFVSCPSAEEIEEVFTAKIFVETHAAELASQRITDEEIGFLEQCMEVEKATHLSRDLHGFNQINYEFHMIIAKASSNRYLEKYISELTTKSNLYLVFFDNFIHTNFEDSGAYKEHFELIHALKKKDKKGAGEAMLKHLQNTFNGLNLKGMK